MPHTHLIFPPEFIWGTATAAYQIEGAADKDGRGPSIWDTFSHIPGNVANNDTGDIACDHYNRLDEDLELIAGVAPNYRFSISWSRIFPDGTGEINQKGVDFYNRLIDGLLARGIEPWATLYHWDLPQALQDKGGWTNRDIVQWFDSYAEKCIELFGDRVKNWMIINEPSIVSYMGHALGIFAPGIRDESAYWACVHHLNMVVGTVYRKAKALRPELNVGSTYTPIPCRTVDPAENDVAQLMECVWHWNFLDPLFRGEYPEIVRARVAPHVQPGDGDITRTKLDFVGLQHYSPIYFTRSADKVLGADFAPAPAHLPKSDMGWPIDPDAFGKILLDLDRAYPGTTWVITENGISLHDTQQADGTVQDDKRIDYLTRYLGAVKGARAKGMNIAGYFVWSLMDNYEWASGYGPRFGLIYIDYDNAQKRTPKKSYHWYRDLIEQQTPSLQRKEAT